MFLSLNQMFHIANQERKFNMSIYSLSHGISSGEKQLRRIMHKINDLRNCGDERRCRHELPKIKIELRNVGCKRYTTSPYVKLMARSILKEIEQGDLSRLSVNCVDKAIVVKQNFSNSDRRGVPHADFRGKATI